MKALVDVDSCIYAAAFACQREVFTVQRAGLGVFSFTTKMIGPKNFQAFHHHTGEPLGSAYSKKELLEVMRQRGSGHEVVMTIAPKPFEEACTALEYMIGGIIVDCQCEESFLVLSGFDNFREQVATILEYKGNRKDKPKPFWYHDLRQWLMNTQEVICRHGIEADDVLAEIQTNDPEGTLVATIDKDLMQFPGRKYYWNKKKGDDTSACHLLVDKALALECLFHQLITGDTSDNIPGLKGTVEQPGPGLRGAKKAFKDCVTAADYYNASLELYVEKYGMGVVDYDSWAGVAMHKTVEEIMLENLTLLWMSRSDEDPLLCTLDTVEKYL